jgi:phosphoglycerol transferase MdoB-like AlkP superfamily enzyme
LTYLLGAHVLALVLMSLFRVVQWVVLHGLMGNTADVSVVPAFIRGIWFDNVIGCYILIVPLAVLLIAAAFGYCARWLRCAAGWWLGIFYTLVLAVSAANIPYFAYFFKNIDASIFGWFGYAGTTAGMLVGETSYWMYFALFLVAVVVLIAALIWLKKRADRKIAAAPKAKGRAGIPVRLVLSAALIGLCVFGIRGRTGYNPIKISQAYYCDDPFLNQLGIAPSFNLITSTLDGMRKENAELHLLPYDEAIAFVRHDLGLTGVADSVSLLRRQVTADTVVAHPNVVIILMESMSASLMQTFGQTERLTPTLDSLYQHSLAFYRFYSAGIHTNHGITATLCSFPALMMRNLMKGTVTPHRSGIASVLHEEGYHNLFFMTHESQYDNMNAFLRTNGYDEVYAQEDYPAEEVANSFGVPDKFLFSYALPVINRTAATGKPFMATLLTISNHPPYVIPPSMPTVTKEPETQIVEYADRCIGEFLAQAKGQPWYDNTIFVILADHGKLVGEMDSELPQSYNHIPCIMFGPGIPEKRYDGLATQIDVMPTLLGFMGISYEYEGFGTDLLRHPRQRVFYTSDTQLVARDSAACVIHNPQMQRDFCYEVGDNGLLRPTERTARHDSLRHYVFAMIQTAEYMQRHN